MGSEMCIRDRYVARAAVPGGAAELLARQQQQLEEAQREKRRGGLLEAVEAATTWFERRLRGPEGKVALDYFTRRGLDSETIAKFRLGYAPVLGRGEASHLSADLIHQGFEIETLVEAGLLNVPEDGRAPYDFFRGRAMFPITDSRGRVIAFGGRVIGDGEPKYLNSRDTPLFDKRRTLYNLANAREACRDAPGPPPQKPAEIIDTR